MSAEERARLVPPGSCTWCGHPPHAVACSEQIRVGKASKGKWAYSPCPCRRAAA